MTSDEFKEWRRSLGFSQDEAATRLGVSRATIGNYEAGRRREDGREVEIPTSIHQACDTIALEEAVLREDPTILTGAVRDRVMKMSAILRDRGLQN